MRHLKKDFFTRSQLFRSIKAEMVYRGINQKDLADKIGIDPSSLNRYLKCTICPSLDIFIRICDALHLRISFYSHR